jgi:hypothetical protein
VWQRGNPISCCHSTFPARPPAPASRIRKAGAVCMLRMVRPARPFGDRHRLFAPLKTPSIKAGTVHRRCRHSCRFRNRRRAVAHGHANASVTRGGRIRPLSCPLPTAPLLGRRPVIRSSFPSASLFPRFLQRPHRPDLQSQCLITPLPSLFAIIAGTTGEDDGERKGSVMKQTLYRLQSRAGLSSASTAAGAAVRIPAQSEQTFCHTSLGVRETGKAAQKGHTP